MLKRTQLQDLHYALFKRDFFTLLADLPPGLSRRIGKLNYGPETWDAYPKFEASDGQQLVFIHVPKCAGTSLARTFGFRSFRHLPASVLRLTNPEAFDRAAVFATVREPLSRLVSLINHFGHAPLAADREREVYAELMEERGGLVGVVEGFVTDARVRDRMFRGTNAGRSGLMTSQHDYLYARGERLVPNLFALKHLADMEAWLSERLGEPVALKRKNTSRKPDGVTFPAELRARVAAFFPEDQALYDEVMDRGGSIVAD